MAVANLFPPDSGWRTLLIYLAPAFSYLVGATVQYLELQRIRLLERWAVKSALQTLRAQLSNPLTSDEHKAAIVKAMEDVEKLVATKELQRIKSVS